MFLLKKIKKIRIFFQPAIKDLKEVKKKMIENIIECFLGEYETNPSFIQPSNLFIGISYLTLNRLE